MPDATTLRATDRPFPAQWWLWVFAVPLDNATSDVRDQNDRTSDNLGAATPDVRDRNDRSTDNRGTFDSLAVGDFVERESDLTTSDQAFPIDANSTSNAALAARLDRKCEAASTLPR